MGELKSFGAVPTGVLARKLRGGWCARGSVRKNRGNNYGRIFRQRQTGNRQKYRHSVGCFRLHGCMVAQLAIWAMRVVRRIVMVPAADDHSGEYQQGDQRQ